MEGLSGKELVIKPYQIYDKFIVYNVFDGTRFLYRTCLSKNGGGKNVIFKKI